MELLKYTLNHKKSCLLFTKNIEKAERHMRKYTKVDPYAILHIYPPLFLDRSLAKKLVLMQRFSILKKKIIQILQLVLELSMGIQASATILDFSSEKNLHFFFFDATLYNFS